MDISCHVVGMGRLFGETQIWNLSVLPLKLVSLAKSTLLDPPTGG